MPAQNFVNILQRITAGELTIGDLINAATGFVAAGQTHLARQLYKIWINFNPAHPQAYVAHFNCAALDSMAGDQAAAVELLQRAVALNPDFLPAYINLGNALERTGAPDKAIETWKSAAARPFAINGSVIGYTHTALKQIARVLSEHHQGESAEATVQLCLDIEPHNHEMIEQYVALRLANCKWPAIVPWERMDKKALTRGIHPLSIAAYTDDPLLQFSIAHRYVKATALGAYASASDRRHAGIDTANRRLRVGYVSSDLRDHAIGYLMAELFELHRRDRIEVFAYYCGPASKAPLNARIKSAVEHWTDIRGLGDDEAAQKIAADGIDILIDVNGHTRDSRIGIFARRPAPVQVNWLGFPGTMASPYHHYIIADDWIIPKTHELYYSETVMRIPCYQPNDRKRVVAVERPKRCDAGLPDNAFVFCSFNGTHKIGRFTFERWMDILGRVKGSALWLLDASEETKNRLGEFAESKGVARSRLVFAPKQHNPQHLARYPLADLVLDTVPYGAHTTASDALWMGVPVLTLSGRGFASRVCGSLVRSAGVPELVCTRPQDYVERAVALAHDPDTIAAYRERLEAGRDTCALFDMDLLVERLEELYRTMAADHQKGRTPRPDLSNIEAYLEAGVEHDHEGSEMLAVADYHGLYKTKLKRLHLARPLHADARLWTEMDIAEADAAPVAGPAVDEAAIPSRHAAAA